jgi:hypothetical protein
MLVHFPATLRERLEPIDSMTSSRPATRDPSKPPDPPIANISRAAHRHALPLRSTSGLPAPEARAGTAAWDPVCDLPWLHSPSSGASTFPRPVQPRPCGPVEDLRSERRTARKRPHWYYPRYHTTCTSSNAPQKSNTVLQENPPLPVCQAYSCSRTKTRLLTRAQACTLTA